MMLHQYCEDANRAHSHSMCVSFNLNPHTGPSVPQNFPPMNLYFYNATFIRIKWNTVDCIHHNGFITNYVVRYRELGHGETMYVNANGRMRNISGLAATTHYEFQVAAQNGAGIGVYNNGVRLFTPECKITCIRMYYCNRAFFPLQMCFSVSMEMFILITV